VRSLVRRLREILRPGIRTLLILLLSPAVLVLLVFDSINDYRTLSNTTNLAYDTVLVESARLLSSSLLLTAEGQVQIAQPLYSQYLIRSENQLHRYFRIYELNPAGIDSYLLSQQGRFLAGNADLPHPPVWPADQGIPVFFDAMYRGQPVRAVAVQRTVRYGLASRRVMVTVAESAAWRSGVETHAQGQELLRDIITLAGEILLLWFGVQWALRSLRRLSREVDARNPDDLTPLDRKGVPSEVVPLVNAINQHLERHRQFLDERSQFLADASHQLRTPLAIISTQAQYALRERDPALAREALKAIIEQLGRSRRLTEQLLSLAHASQGEGIQHKAIDLADIARNSVMQYLPLAHEKEQDLGWVDARAPDSGEARVFAGEVELHETLSNLIHNAIRYAPERANITVSIAEAGDRYEVAVTDNGPGIAPDLREKVFERFERGGRSSVTGGSGLGLSIARAYARRNGGDIDLRDGEINENGACGLKAVLWLPRMPD
jgi:two-component system sensor histidine kinase TctE